MVVCYLHRLENVRWLALVIFLLLLKRAQMSQVPFQMAKRKKKIRRDWEALVVNVPLL